MGARTNLEPRGDPRRRARPEVPPPALPRSLFSPRECNQLGAIPARQGREHTPRAHRRALKALGGRHIFAEAYRSPCHEANTTARTALHR